jgi:Calcineurin-like phosphoesterase
VCLTTYLAYKVLLQKPLYRPNQNVVVDIEPNMKVAIIGDWGTGDDVAANLLEQAAAVKPDILLHLGDIYYAGTENEARTNFRDLCRSVLGNVPLYSLCGNHDMYSGGGGYYWLLDQIGQKSSYFCLRNNDWIFLAMDTGFHDNNPFNVSTNMTELVDQDGWSEAAWHLNQIAEAGSRKVVLFSHHQLFSPFASVGSVDETPYAYNPNIYRIFAPVLPKVEWWFWGYEHTLGVYPSYMGLKRGRCIGASAVPIFQDQQSYATASGLKTLDGLSMPTWDPNAVLGGVDNMYNNCFAMMSLSGPSATVEYYEVPLIQSARKFSVTDRV